MSPRENDRANESSTRWLRIEKHLEENAKSLGRVELSTAVLTERVETHMNDSNQHTSLPKIIGAIAAFGVSLGAILTALSRFWPPTP